MAIKAQTHRLPFNISREIRCALAMNLTVILFLTVHQEATRAVTIIHPMQENKRIIAQQRFEEGDRLRAQGTTGSLRKAIEKYAEALVLFQAVGDRERENSLLVTIGLGYSTLGEWQKAIDHLNPALPFIRAAGDQQEEASILLIIGKMYHSLEKEPEALDYFSQSLLLSRASGDHYGEANSLFHVGQAHFAMQENEKAIDSWNQSLPLFRTAGSRGGEAVTLASLGRLYVSQGEKHKAIGYFNQTLPLSKNLTTKDEAALLNEMAELHYSLGEKQKALDCLELALPLMRVLGDRQGEANTLSGIGKICAELGNKQKALDNFSQTLPINQSLGNRPAAGNNSVNLGLVYSLLGKNREALEHLNQALSLFRDLNDQNGEANALNGLGKVYVEMCENPKAFEYLAQALGLYRATGDRNGEGFALTNIGQAYASSGESQKAIDHLNQAVPIFQTTGDRSGEALALNGLGFIYEAIGEKRKALDYLNQALPLTHATGDRRTETILLFNLAWIYDELDEKQRALEFYDQALRLSRAAGERRAEAYTLTGIGWTYESLAENKKAFNYSNLALPLFRALEDRRGEAYALVGAGMARSSSGEKQEALDYLRQALKFFRAVGDQRGEEMTLYRIACIERDRGHLSEAKTQIEAALNIVESLRIKVVNQDLRISYRASMQDYYELYIDLLMQLHKQRPNDGYEASALQASERARAQSLLENLTEGRANIREGVDQALLTRERTLQQQLNAKAEFELKLSANLHTEFQAATVKKEIETLRTDLQQIQTQIRQSSPRYAALTQPQPLTPAQIQQQVLDADTLLLEYALGEERSYLWAVTPTTINSYELPKRDEIETLARQVHDLLAAGDRNVRGETDDQRAIRLRHANGQYSEAAAKLSQVLLGPVAEKLGSKRLVIVADGALQYVPFGALPVPMTNDKAGIENLAGRWKIMLPTPRPESNLKNAEKEADPAFTPLIIKHEIVNLPSASTLAVLRHELAGRKPAPKTLAVLADPVFRANDERVRGRVNQVAAKPDDSVAGLTRQRILKRMAREKDELDISRLPFTRQEAEQILALVPAGEGMKALDFEASRETVMSDQLSQYRYVHFATHGQADSERPELSTIVLSLFDEQGGPVDGFLRAHDVYNLNLPAEMVVLSACETGLGKLTKGEGLVSLTRGFMYAGAARVVVSLWSVSDRATADLMTKFYRKILAEGERPAAALRAAQIEMWKTKQWEAPYYWAAFTLQGEWR